MPDKLDNIRVPVFTTGNNQSDPDTEQIAKKHAYNELIREQQQAEEDVKDSRQNRAQRKEYAEKIFWLVCAWLASLVLIVWNVGTRYLWLSDAVVVAIVTGATVNIIGLMVIVANYLFPKNGQPRHKNE